MHGVLVDLSVKYTNRYYNIELVNPEAYDRLHEHPNYLEVLRMLTNEQSEWKLNSEGHVVHFKAKHLAYIPKVWHHFITSRLILTTNVCELTAKRALVTTQKYPRIFIIILLYILGINRTKLGFFREFFKFFMIVLPNFN